MQGWKEGRGRGRSLKPTFGGLQARLREADANVEQLAGAVALEATLRHPCGEGGGPPAGLERAQQAAPTLMPHQAAEVVVRLGKIPTSHPPRLGAIHGRILAGKTSASRHGFPKTSSA